MVPLPRKSLFAGCGSLIVAALVWMHPTDDTIRAGITAVASLFATLMIAHTATDISAGKKHK
jgi:hypothetical protein